MYDRRPGFFRNEESPPGRRVDAKVKWFNAAKGFGFVTPADGTQDAFLPMATLRRAGFEEVREGASLICEIGSGAKGPLVVNVLNVDNSTAVPAGAGGGFGGNGGGGGGFGAAPRKALSTLDGSVKWFEPQKGFGFISPDGGGKDIFIHITALRRSGLEGLDPGMRVRVDVVDGKKGLEADRVTVI
jgi:CspA family cold shock protein